ncbi:hypothetical protein [Streptomyces sp. NPDC056401]|uniref:hypothetical protein n=1 Tax=Streptomyces sp. NPDC056401 TaxID=3345809 RepID=UPI0035D862A9
MPSAKPDHRPFAKRSTDRARLGRWGCGHWQPPSFFLDRLVLGAGLFAAKTPEVAGS